VQVFLYFLLLLEISWMFIVFILNCCRKISVLYGLSEVWCFKSDLNLGWFGIIWTLIKIGFSICFSNLFFGFFRTTVSEFIIKEQLSTNLGVTLIAFVWWEPVWWFFWYYQKSTACKSFNTRCLILFYQTVFVFLIKH
jgi:hypothetical protein